MDIFERIGELRRGGRRAVLVTVVETHGSTPRKAGARMLVYPDGVIEGTVGGGAVEHTVREAAARVAERQSPELVKYKLTEDLAMGCGGEMSLFVEPVLKNPTLIIFGCGHVGTALVHAASPLGFDIIAIDDLVQNASPETLPEAVRIINSFEPADLSDLPFGDDTYVVIVTRKHAFDGRFLELCAPQTTRYLGVIGSRRKAAQQRQRLEELGLSSEQIEHVRCPMGLDIGALTPEEIAVAVCAELIAVRRGGPRFGGGEAS